MPLNSSPYALAFECSCILNFMVDDCVLLQISWLQLEQWIVEFIELLIHYGCNLCIVVAYSLLPCMLHVLLYGLQKTHKMQIDNQLWPSHSYHTQLHSIYAYMLIWESNQVFIYGRKPIEGGRSNERIKSQTILRFILKFSNWTLETLHRYLAEISICYILVYETIDVDLGGDNDNSYFTFYFAYSLFC